MKLLTNILILVLVVGLSTILAQPDSPQNITANSVTIQFEGISKTVVKLSWDKVKDMDGQNIPIYEIFRKDGTKENSNEFNSIGEVLWASNKFDGEVEVGKTYTYYIVAKDFSNNVSQPSEYVQITVGEDPQGGGNSLISGNVIDSETSLPLDSIYVVLVSTSSFSVKTVMTNSDGNYSADVFPGEYIVYFKASRDYFHQYYNNVKHVWEATRINLLEGEELTDIDAALVPIKSVNMFSVSGKVLDNSGNPLKARVEIFVDSFDRTIKRRFHARTDDNGDYNVMIPENSTIIVFAVPIENGYYGEFFNDTYSMTEAERIFVDQNIPDVNFVLEESIEGGGSVKGLVKNTSENLVDAMIIAIRLGADRNNRNGSLRTFTEEGAFSFSNLVPGDYIFYAIPEEGYLPTFYKETGDITNNWREADIISFENDSSENIVFIVKELPERPEAALGEISGFVVDDENRPVSEALILIYDDENKVASFSVTDSEGKYAASDLEAGFYTITCSNYGLTYEENSNVFVGIDNQTNSNFVLKPDSPVNVNESEIVQKYYLNQNYPNPFNPSTNIEFAIMEQSEVELKVYNILGAEIVTLLNKELSSGSYSIEFKPDNLPSGLYIYQLKTNDFIQSKKMLLLK